MRESKVKTTMMNETVPDNLQYLMNVKKQLNKEQQEMLHSTQRELLQLIISHNFLMRMSHNKY